MSEYSEQIRGTEYEDNIKRLQSRIATLQTINEGHKRTNQRNEVLKQELKKQREDADAKSQRINAQFNELKDILQKLQKENRDLRIKLQNLELSQLGSSVGSDSEIGIEANDEVRRLTMLNIKLKDQADYFEYENKKLSKTVEQLQKELQEYKVQRKDLVSSNISFDLNQDTDFNTQALQKNSIHQSNRGLRKRSREQTVQLIVSNKGESSNKFDNTNASSDKQAIQKLGKLMQERQRMLEDKQKFIDKLQIHNQRLRQQNRDLSQKMQQKQDQITAVKIVYEQKLKKASNEMIKVYKDADLLREQFINEKKKLEKLSRSEKIQRPKEGKMVPQEGQMIAYDESEGMLQSFHLKVKEINDFLRKLELNPDQFKRASENRLTMRNVMKAIVDQVVR